MLTVNGTKEVEATKKASLYVAVASPVVEDTKVYLYCTNSNVYLPEFITIIKGDTTASITYTPPSEVGFVGYNILCMLDSYNSIFSIVEKESTTIEITSNPLVKGGNNLTLTITLDASPNTDQTIYLEEENLPEYPAVLTVPSVATVLTGDISGTSTINTKTVVKNTPTVIVATYKGVKYYHNITVTP